MTNLVDAIKKKFDAIIADNIPIELKMNPSAQSRGLRCVCTDVITMDNENITHLGDPRNLSSIFENLRELDLSFNKIKSWAEVFEILECSPRLQMLNLSYNPLHLSSLFCTSSDPANCQHSYSYSSTCSAPDVEIDWNRDINHLADLSFKELDAAAGDDMDILENSLADSLLCSPSEKQLLSSNLKTLALNSTYIQWQHILTLISYLPSLTTLHVALNSFDRCCDAEVPSADVSGTGDDHQSFPQLTHLFFSENNISDWSAVCCLGRHFPGLEHLVLIGNPLSVIPKPHNNTKSNTSCPKYFEKLVKLNLAESDINSWDSVDALTLWMPSLLSLRLGQSLPLFRDEDAHAIRSDVIARLPRLSSYNSTPISPDERERAERDFVRRYGQMNAEQRPDRYWDLECQHGRVEPLAVVDLTPKRVVRMRVRLGDQEKWHTFGLRKSIAKVKLEVCNIYNIDEKMAKNVHMYYVDQGMVEALGHEELRIPTRLLYTYHPEDGDALELFYVAPVPRKSCNTKRAVPQNTPVKESASS